ncbi:hypothetical protein H6P81_013752 [Aristolochia fimbriata]|uniref:DUF4408 domain-containing protein n=1 Tax=Aristolochia fimbriata TaxID=158543 RepID=A0AAV7EH75_ARIFI|nr:hypothetical protein H6P81_013752 [Aristolochia fimbriata]
MEKFHKSQCAKILLIALLLLVTPLLSSSIRPLYLYLLFNLLVIALGAESGVLSAISRPPMTSTTTASAKQPLINITNSYKEPMTAPSPGADTQEEETVRSVVTASEVTECNGAAVSTAKAAVQRSASEKAKQAPKMAVKIGEVVKKCPSMPSLFFIGGCDGDEEGAEEEEEEEEMGVPTKQELFAKAETFIGNFYKQLKIQREDSWKRIQNSLYHRRAF